MKRDRTAIAAAAAAALLFAPLVLPLLTGRVYRQGDLAQFHIPLRFLYAKALAAGDSVTWSRALFCGFYLHGEGQLGMFHPFHWLLYRLLPLADAFDLELLASYGAAFAGMTCLLRRAALSLGASMVGGVAFAFSGFNLVHLMHMNMVAVNAHVPWLLLAADVMLTASTPALAAGGFLLFTASLASALLLGYPQSVWMAAVVTSGFAVARAARLRAWVRLLGIAVATAAGVLLGAAQWLPTLDALADSTRRVVPADFGLTYSLHPLNLLQLWCPYVFAGRFYAPPSEPYMHEFAVYDGAFCAIAFAWTLARWRRLEHRALAAGGVALCLAGLALALGAYGGVYPLLERVPLLGKFRAPARHVLVMHLGFAILAALTFEDLVRSRAAARSPRTAGPVVAVVILSAATAVMAGFYSATHDVLPLHQALPSRLAASVAIVAVAALLVWNGARGQAWAVVALPFCLALDLGAWGYAYVWTAPPLKVRQLQTLIPLPPDARPGERLDLKDVQGLGNVALLRGFERVDGYAGLEPRKRLPLDVTTRRLAGVTWAMTGGTFEPVPSPMPRVRLVRDARVSDDPERDIREIDVERTALVSEDVGPLDARGGTATVDVDRAGRLEVAVVAGGRALLVTTESYHAGWRASAASRALRTVGVNGDFLGVLVEEGVSHVTLVFDPWSTRLGVRLSFAGLVLAALGALAIARLGGTVKKGDSPPFP